MFWKECPAHLKVIRSKQQCAAVAGCVRSEDYEIELTDLNAVGGVPLVVRVPNNLWTIPTDWDDRSVSIRVRAVLPNGITGDWSSNVCCDAGRGSSVGANGDTIVESKSQHFVDSVTGTCERTCGSVVWTRRRRSSQRVLRAA